MPSQLGPLQRGPTTASRMRLHPSAASEASAGGGGTSCLPGVAVRLTLQREEAPGAEEAGSTEQKALELLRGLAGLSQPPGDPRRLQARGEGAGDHSPQRAGVRCSGSPWAWGVLLQRPTPPNAPPDAVGSGGGSCSHRARTGFKKKRDVILNGLIFGDCELPAIPWRRVSWALA